MLDREVADAAARIEPVGGREGARRADVEAAPAAAAMVALGRIGRQVEVGQDLAQEQPGAELAAHEVGVLALPAQARLLCRGFSSTGAVSTNTLTAPPKRAASQPASSLSRPLSTSW